MAIRLDTEDIESDEEDSLMMSLGLDFLMKDIIQNPSKLWNPELVHSQVTNKLDAITKSIEQLAKTAGAFQSTNNNNQRRSSEYNIYHQPTPELEPFTHENLAFAPGVKR